MITVECDKEDLTLVVGSTEEQLILSGISQEVFTDVP